jgi:tetratricopeptide (TPR) repeat protein
MRVSAIPILVALFLWPVAVFGQSPELVDAYNRVNELYAEGRYQQAFPFAKEALRLSEREFGPDHSNTAITLNNLALLYHNQGRYAEAEPLFKSALTIIEKALGPDLRSRIRVQRSFSVLKNLLEYQHHLSEAEFRSV